MSEAKRLLELAERCEQAAGPDEQLDCDIHEAVFRGRVLSDEEIAERRGKGENVFSGILVWQGALTASLDAALTLVPEGIVRIVFVQVGGRWGCYLDNDRGVIGSCDGASTKHLALCAAALRTRASHGDQS